MEGAHRAGAWKVRIEQAHDVDVADAPFAAANFKDGDFGAIEVPGHLQMAGYLRNKYVNIQYPWDGHEDPQAPDIPENNHVAIYRHRFSLDAPLVRTLRDGGTVSLTFHGAATAIYVWLDGIFVGYGEDGFTPSEFDVTEALRGTADGESTAETATRTSPTEHTLTVACYEYSSASWLEDQDFWRLHGLFRSVELAAQPRTHVETMQIEVDYDTTGITDTAKLDATLADRSRLRHDRHHRHRQAGRDARPAQSSRRGDHRKRAVRRPWERRMGIDAGLQRRNHA